jgi:hypothetical protein
MASAVVDDKAVDLYDPTARSCAWCYAVLRQVSGVCTTACRACPRAFCDEHCRDLDWQTHAFWCGKAGEKGVDFDVCKVHGKGLGLITRRAFVRGEKILAERPVLTTNNIPMSPGSPQTDDSVRAAAMALTPSGGSLDDKINANGVSLTQSNEHTLSAGLFVTFSRVNHDCLGNSDHYFDHQHGVELLVANDRIEANTEITFPYTRTGHSRHNNLTWRGFTCVCRACRSPFWGDKVNQISELDEQVVALGGQPSSVDRALAVQSAHTLLQLFDDVHASCRDYARVHYDLFQILILQEASLGQARHHIVMAHQYALAFCGYEQHETVQMYKEYVEHPERHGNYRAID